MHFQFPTGDDWALMVATYRRPLKENIESAVFTWWKLSAPYPAGILQNAFENSQGGAQFRTLMNWFIGPGVLNGFNYYFQSGGNKFSNNKAGTIYPGFGTDLLPLFNSLCIRKYRGVRGDQWCGRMSIPIVDPLYCNPGGYLSSAGRISVNGFIAQYLLGFTFAPGVHARPVVYRPTTDSFVDITKMRVMDTIRTTRRRRFRARKVGHTFTAPLNWYAPGHW